MKNKNKLLLIAGAGAIIGYRAFKGMGAFNKIRFKRQYTALKSYIDTHFPDAQMGELVSSCDGWSCPIVYNGKNFIISIIETEHSGYIFTPTEV